MASNEEKKDEKKRSNIINQSLQQLNKIIGKSNLSLYGTDRISDVDKLNNQFQSILHTDVDSITNKDNEDVTSFLSKLYSQDRKISTMEQLLDNQFMSISGDEYSTMQSFIYEAYRNKLLEQSDLHEISSQLIELNESILTTRDAIISSEVVEGRLNRTLDFQYTDNDNQYDYKTVVEHIEKRFELQEKIKEFIVPKTLEYGEYYAYIIPYSKIFNDFVKQRDQGSYRTNSSVMYYRGESVSLLESVQEEDVKEKKKNNKNSKTFVEGLYDDYVKQVAKSNERNHRPTEQLPNKNEFMEDVNAILGNISINNDPVPIPILEEGIEGISFFRDSFVTESGERLKDKKDILMEAENDKFISEKNPFNKIIQSDPEKGITFVDRNTAGDGSGQRVENFDDIKDCYIKVIEPTRILPLKIMNQVIGYYYVVAEDITPLSGMISSTLYYSKFDEDRKEQNIIDSIAEKIVKSFNKKFLKENLKFKKTIVDAITHYNLNEHKLKFQFIPVEYIQPFKINKDEEDNGQSMIKKSLFYAKLYLMLLLFKIMSIILYSNDQRVNYIKTSGLDKNLANKVQEIARIKQSRQINMIDLFNYTTLINKVGNGAELYIPTGRTSERPIETEILSGQEIQLNTELMEMLKNSYILATGVPSTILNYLNEADFAKIIEQQNSKYNARVVNYQLDFNRDITEMYKKILKWSTDLPQNVIDSFSFTLQPPKTTVTNAKTEAINAFNSLVEFITQICYEDPNNTTNPQLNDEIRIFKKLFAKEQLPMLNMERIEELIKEAKMEAKDENLKPDPINGDNDNDGFEGDFDEL